MAQWAGDKRAGQFYYSTNYLTDIEHNVIVDVEPTPSHRIAEVTSTQTMIEWVEENLGIKTDRLIVDTSYGSAAMLDWVVEQKQINPHIPVWEKSRVKPGIFSRSDFIWDNEADCYHCPGENHLQSRRRQFKKLRSPVTKANTIIYRSSQPDCRTYRSETTCQIHFGCLERLLRFRKLSIGLHSGDRPKGAPRLY